MLASENKIYWIRTHLGEFLATFIFTFAVFCNVLNNASSTVSAIIGPIACGFAAYAAVFCFGGHFNPAVTVAAMIGHKIALVPGAIYLAVQLAAAFLACGLAVSMFPGTDHATTLVLQPNAQASTPASFFMEFTLTFILVLVIYRAAMGVQVKPKMTTSASLEDPAVSSESETVYRAHVMESQYRKHHAGLVIGLTISSLCCLGGGVSGGAFNPLRVTPPAFMALDFDNLWLYWVADLAGAAAAGALHKYVFEDH